MVNRNEALIKAILAAGSTENYITAIEIWGNENFSDHIKIMRGIEKWKAAIELKKEIRNSWGIEAYPDNYLSFLKWQRWLKLTNQLFKAPKRRKQHESI